MLYNSDDDVGNPSFVLSSDEERLGVDSDSNSEEEVLEVPQIDTGSPTDQRYADDNLQQLVTEIPPQKTVPITSSSTNWLPDPPTIGQNIFTRSTGFLTLPEGKKRLFFTVLKYNVYKLRNESILYQEINNKINNLHLTVLTT